MSCKFFLQPWLRIMNKFATIVAQNEQICKEEAPPPHVEPPLMWKLHMWRHHYVEAPQCGGSTYVEHHGCAKCNFVQPWLCKMQICATTVAQNANLRNHLANLFKFAMCGGGASSQGGGASS